MTYRRIVMIVSLTTLLLSACSAKTFDINETEVNEVKISYFTDFGSINGDDLRSFHKEEDIKGLVAAINTAKPIDGDVDMPAGDYNVLVNFADDTSKGFHLWISEDDSVATIMKLEDTATAYKLTKSATNRIRSILFD
ncbi:hypothetical protein [Lentibacillus saliphilus]|uniref:hypothetical protein n=1 Tax=Lentibacillus saliphilus TaxID=2737028 RepID=UPI001C2F7DC4|nr:hypothetical protein [Lentibacillus saliphilus]